MLRHMVVRLLAACVAALLVVSCGSQAGPALTAASDVSRVAFLPEEETYPLALLAGTLGGDPYTGCLWVSGSPGTGRTAFLLHEDTAVLDVSAEVPVIRDGDRILAAFGEAVRMGGGNTGSPPAPGCEEHGEPFTAHGLQQELPGVAPTVALSQLRRGCGPTNGPALVGRLSVSGLPRQPLLLEVDAPDGTLLARQELPATEGTTDLLVPLDNVGLVPDLPPEWNVRVSEREQVVAQALVDLRPGPVCG
jgi:hypothetical protein